MKSHSCWVHMIKWHPLGEVKVVPAQQFCIGAEVVNVGPVHKRASVVRSIVSMTVKGRFVRKEGQPHLQEWVLKATPFQIEIIYEEPEKPPRLTLQFSIWLDTYC